MSQNLRPPARKTADLFLTVQLGCARKTADQARPVPSLSPASTVLRLTHQPCACRTPKICSPRIEGPHRPQLPSACPRRLCNGNTKIPPSMRDILEESAGSSCEGRDTTPATGRAGQEVFVSRWLGLRRLGCRWRCGAVPGWRHVESDWETGRAARGVVASYAGAACRTVEHQLHGLWT